MKKRRSKPWTIEDLKLEVGKYKTLKDFRTKSGGAYVAARKLGVMKDITSSLRSETCRNSGWRSKGYWTEERVREVAKKFKTKRDFKKAYSGAYHKAKTLGIFEEITRGMEVLGSHYKRYLYVFEFSDNSIYVGLTYDYQVRYSEHISRNPVIVDKIKLGIDYKFIRFNKLHTYDTAGDAEESLINRYKDKGYTILNKVKAGSIGGLKSQWDKDAIRAEAKKYSRRVDFKNNANAAYTRARKFGYLDEVCSHMEKSKRYYKKKDYKIFEI